MGLIASILEAIYSLGGTTSHSAHCGGAVGGIFAGLAFSRIVNKNRAKDVVQSSAFCLMWGWQWPPRDIWEKVPWCWSRQVNNKTFFGDNAWHCVRCADQQCIDKWS